MERLICCSVWNLECPLDGSHFPLMLKSQRPIPPTLLKYLPGLLTLVMLNKLRCILPYPLLIVSQSDSLIQIVDINSHTEWQTVQIQISWLLQKPDDLDLHCLQSQGISEFSRTRVNSRYEELSIKCFTYFALKTYMYAVAGIEV